jgi:hypothetical protein
LLYTKLSLFWVAHHAKYLARHLIPISEHRALYKALKLVKLPIAATFWNLFSSLLKEQIIKCIPILMPFFLYSHCAISPHWQQSTSQHKDCRQPAETPSSCPTILFSQLFCAIQPHPGDHFFFNHLFIYSCSAKLPEYKQCNVSLMTFYLKATCTEGHDGDDMELTNIQSEMVEEYKKLIKQKMVVFILL